MQVAVMCSLALVPMVALGCSKDADPASERALGHSPEEPPIAKQAPETEVIFETDQGEKRVALEVAATPARIQRGLMHRQHLAPDRGMLFVFAGDRVRSFWMKNTLIPLDMLFVTKDLVVAGVVRNTTPLSLESRSVGIPTRYVIEVNGGWTEENGVYKGTTLRLENLPAIGKPPM